MKQESLKAAVLISGTGSNLKALIRATEKNDLDLNIVRVISNRTEAPGLAHANKADIPVSVITHKSYPDRQAHDAAVCKVLLEDEVEFVVLAGYMRILGEEFTDIFDGRMINLHPSLLPEYKGLDTYNRVLRAGDNETGASIHFVTAGLDSGPVISQVRIPVLADDDAASLSARLGPMEHKLVVATVGLFCKREIGYANGVVTHHGKPIERPLLLNHDGTFAD